MSRLSFLLVVLVCVACGDRPIDEPQRVATSSELVVARVDGRPIFASDVRAQMVDGQTPKQALQSLVQLELLAGEAHRRGLQRSAEVSKTQRRAMAALLAKRVAEAITPEKVDRSLILRAYKLNLHLFRRPETVLVSHLLCGARPASSPEVKAGALRCRDAAIAYFAKHKPTLEQFEQLPKALRKISAPAVVKVEQLITGRRGYTVRQFAKAAFEAKQGVVKGPVHTSFGEHFIYRIKTNPPLDKSLKDVEGELRKRVLPNARKIMFERWATALEKRHAAQADGQAFLRALGAGQAPNALRGANEARR